MAPHRFPRGSTPGLPRSRARAGIAAVFVVLAAVGLLIAIAVLRSEDELHVAVDPAPSAGARSQGHLAGLPARAPEGIEPTLPARAAEESGIVELAEQADRLRELARYPQWSRPLEGELDPSSFGHWLTLPAETGEPDGSKLVVYTSRSSYEHAEPAVIFAYLEDEGRYQSLARAEATVKDETAAAVDSLVLRDDGRAPDAVASDLIYSAAFVPPNAPDLQSTYLAEVRVTDQQGNQQSAELFLSYGQTRARLTGQFRDAVQDGNLVIEVEVSVERAGAFHMEGSLYDAEGKRALVWASAQVELAPGRHWVALRFYGLALREAELSGPYMLRRVSLARETDQGRIATPPLEARYLTGAHDVLSFTDAPFDEPAVLRGAEVTEEEMSGLDPG